MTRPVEHLTWGEEQKKHLQLQDLQGHPIFLTLARYVTLCKRLADDAQLPPHLSLTERPLGVCKPCWKRYQKDLLEIEQEELSSMKRGP